MGYRFGSGGPVLSEIRSLFLMRGWCRISDAGGAEFVCDVWYCKRSSVSTSDQEYRGLKRKRYHRTIQGRRVISGFELTSVSCRRGPIDGNAIIGGGCGGMVHGEAEVFRVFRVLRGGFVEVWHDGHDDRSKWYAVVCAI